MAKEYLKCRMDQYGPLKCNPLALGPSESRLWLVLTISQQLDGT